MATTPTDSDSNVTPEDHSHQSSIIVYGLRSHYHATPPEGEPGAEHHPRLPS